MLFSTESPSIFFDPFLLAGHAVFKSVDQTNCLLFSDDAIQAVASKIFEDREEASVDSLKKKIVQVRCLIANYQADVKTLQEHLLELQGIKEHAPRSFVFVSYFIQLFYGWFNRREIEKDKVSVESLEKEIANLSLLLQELRKKKKNLKIQQEEHNLLNENKNFNIYSQSLPSPALNDNKQFLDQDFALDATVSGEGSSRQPAKQDSGRARSIDPQTLNAFSGTCQSILNEKTFSADDLQSIFEIEHTLREWLEQNPDYPDLAKIYQESLIPAYNKAKAYISNRLILTSSKIAAAKGQALQAGIAALNRLTQPIQTISFSKQSSNQLFLLPNEVVYKKSSRRSKEEEDIVDQLFHLRSPKATVPEFPMKWLARSRYGIKADCNHYLRGYIDSPLLDASLRKTILNKLSGKNKKIEQDYAGQYFATPDDGVGYSSKTYWEYQPKEGQPWQCVSFPKLRKLYEQELLEGDCLIKQKGRRRALKLAEHLCKETALGKALHSKPQKHELILVPDLADPRLKQIYESCESVKWSFKDSRGKQRKVNFKALQTRYLSKKTLLEVTVDDQANLTDSTRATLNRQVHQALNSGWTLIAPEALKEEIIQQVVPLPAYQPIRQIKAKPFIKEMKSVCEYQQTPSLLQAILQRLDEKSLWNILITGELQFLDLHANNVGLAPQQEGYEEAYQCFKDTLFTISPFPIDTIDQFKGQPPMPFGTLYENHLQGKLDPHAWISYQAEQTSENGEVTAVLISKKLGELKELHALLERSWQFKFYDLDLNMSEDNELQVQSKLIESNEESRKRGSLQYRTEHLIPLRNVFLELPIKDIPLSESLWHQLENSASSDQQLKAWCRRDDAPIRKRLPIQYLAELDNRLKPFLNQSRYSLSSHRQQNSNCTIQDIRAMFVEDFVALDSVGNKVFWDWLEEGLSQARVLAGDTWESLAARYKQSLSKLKELNAHRLPNPGQCMRIHYQLSDESRSSLRRRRSIAAQLFYRITWKQYESLAGRQASRSAYLENYQTLKRSQGFQSITENLQLFLTSPAAPITTFQKKTYLDSLKAIVERFQVNPNEEQTIIDLKDDILKKCQPTYFNVLKSMYPLLADAFELNSHIFKSEAEAGRKIGYYDFSLEKVIQEARTNYPEGSETCRLANLMENKIRSKTDPAYFGTWK